LGLKILKIRNRNKHDVTDPITDAAIIVVTIDKYSITVTQKLRC